MKFLALTLCLLAGVCTALPQFGGRIVGGQDAVRHSAPYIVSIRWNLVQGVGRGSHFCGGAILNENWVVTAAHCIMNVGHQRIVAGDHDVSIDEATEQVRNIAQRIVHPLYPGGLSVAPFDIALFRMDTPFVFNDFVQPIALPAQDFIHSGTGTAFGWGDTSNSSASAMPNILQTIQKSILTIAECRAANTISGSLVHDTNMCTGPLHSNVDTCGGDSGGPFVQVNGNGVLELVGIVSWGPNPCGAGPSVKVRISAFTDWLNQNMS